MFRRIVVSVCSHNMLLSAAQHRVCNFECIHVNFPFGCYLPVLLLTILRLKPNCQKSIFSIFLTRIKLTYLNAYTFSLLRMCDISNWVDCQPHVHFIGGMKWILRIFMWTIDWTTWLMLSTHFYSQMHTKGQLLLTIPFQCTRTYDVKGRVIESQKHF